MWLFAVFVAVPIIEIALFIQVGGAIGLFPTLAIVVLTAMVGTFLVRKQGLEELRRLQGALNALSDPTRPLAHGAMILASGLLLLTPGFFTDAVGLSLLIPAVRDALMRAVQSRIEVQRFQMGDPSEFTTRRRPPPFPDDSVIDGDYVEVTRPQRAGPSGWTQGDDDRDTPPRL